MIWNTAQWSTGDIQFSRSLSLIHFFCFLLFFLLPHLAMPFRVLQICCGCLFSFQSYFVSYFLSLEWHTLETFFALIYLYGYTQSHWARFFKNVPFVRHSLSLLFLTFIPTFFRLSFDYTTRSFVPRSPTIQRLEKIVFFPHQSNKYRREPLSANRFFFVRN